MDLLVALRVAYTRPTVGQHCIVGNGILSEVFAGLLNYQMIKETG